MKEYIDLLNIKHLMSLTVGSANVTIGLIDGPISINHSSLNKENIYKLSKANTCSVSSSVACSHGTFIAGVLKANRDSIAPGLCPGCTLVVRPVFSEYMKGNNSVPFSNPQELAAAINECIVAGARIINLSLSLAFSSIQRADLLEEALNKAMRHGVIVVAAAGNQNSLGSSSITRHQWVIPVIGCNSYGQPLNESNLGISIGRRGFSAPGDRITSLGSEDKSATFSGTSVAVPFVTGTVALLWSLFPSATATQLKLALTQAPVLRRSSVAPPVLNGDAAYQILLKTSMRRQIA